MKSDLVDITVQLHAATAKAILVSDDGDKAKAVWLPLSLIEWDRPPSKPPYIVEVTLPEWLALDKGLL